MLSDPDPSVCHDAVYAPGKIGLAEPEALAALRVACEHRDGRVRTAAQQALLTIRRRPASWD